MQLDVKLSGGVPLSILEEAVDVAGRGRCEILDTMEASLFPESGGHTAAAADAAAASGHGHGQGQAAQKRAAKKAARAAAAAAEAAGAGVGLDAESIVAQDGGGGGGGGRAESGNGGTGELFARYCRDRLSLKPFAPRLRVITFARDRLSFLLGPGGGVKRAIEAEFGVTVEVGDVLGGQVADQGEALPFGVGAASAGTSGGGGGGGEAAAQCVAHVFGGDKAACEAAARVVQELVCDVEEGSILSGVVKEVRDYGAVVQVLRGRTGLLHVSEISNSLRGAAAVGLLKVCAVVRSAEAHLIRYTTGR